MGDFLLEAFQSDVQLLERVCLVQESKRTETGSVCLLHNQKVQHRDATAPPEGLTEVVACQLSHFLVEQWCCDLAGCGVEGVEQHL